MHAEITVWEMSTKEFDALPVLAEGTPNGVALGYVNHPDERDDKGKQRVYVVWENNWRLFRSRAEGPPADLPHLFIAA